MAIDPPAGKAPAPGKDGKAVDTKNQDAKVVDTVVSAPRKCCKCCCGCCDNNFSWCTMCICANKGEYTDGLAQCKTPTDCFCLVIYLVVMAFAVYGMFYGLTYGDVRNIGQPYDRDGIFQKILKFRKSMWKRYASKISILVFQPLGHEPG